METIKIGSFNVEHFNSDKVDPEGGILPYLVQIARRYDILFLQEMKDRTVAEKFFYHVNNRLQDKNRYGMIVTDPMGRSASYKESYAYFFKKEYFTLRRQFTYDSFDADEFERPPFIVQFETNSAGNSKVAGGGITITLIGVHTQPSNAVAEITLLDNVCKLTRQRFEITKSNNRGKSILLILGDLNAGGEWVRDYQLRQFPLRSNTDQYEWLIKDEDLTMVGGDRRHAYDRIILANYGQGREMIVGGRAKVFRFDNSFGLRNQAALQISDHYPVEVDLAFQQQDDDDDDNFLNRMFGGMSINYRW